MSLLTICQDVADTIGFPPPTAIISGTDQISRQMRGFARETLEELCRMEWPILSVPYTFNLVIGQAEYELPADYKEAVNDTVYISSQYYQARGSLSPADWARERNALPTQLGVYKFRVYGLPLKLYITPTPENTEVVTLEYKTTNKVRQTNGDYASNYFDDGDVSIVAEELVKKGLRWRMRRAKGLDYSEEFDDYERSRFERLGQQLSMGSMPVGYRNLIDEAYCPYPYVPEFGFGQ